MWKMQISSYQESTIDYPGKYGPIIFTQGCNFKCGFCHNPELAPLDVEGVDKRKFLNEVKRKAKSGWYNSIVISGGEPTLYEDLPEFVKELKRYGLAIKLDSNGSNPEMLERLLEKGNIDYVAMDIKAPREGYRDVVGVNVDVRKIDKGIELVKRFPMYEFRTTVLPWFSENDLMNIGEWVVNADEGKNQGEDKKVKLYTIQQFNPKKCFDKKYEKLEPKSKEEIENLGRVMTNYSQNVRVLGL